MFTDQEFPLWLSRLRIRHSVREGASLIPGLTQWVKDLALPELQLGSQMQLGSGVTTATALI